MGDCYSHVEGGERSRKGGIPGRSSLITSRSDVGRRGSTARVPSGGGAGPGFDFLEGGIRQPYVGPLPRTSSAGVYSTPLQVLYDYPLFLAAGLVGAEDDRGRTGDGMHEPQDPPACTPHPRLLSTRLELSPKRSGFHWPSDPRNGPSLSSKPIERLYTNGRWDVLRSDPLESFFSSSMPMDWTLRWFGTTRAVGSTRQDTMCSYEIEGRAKK